MPHFKCLACKTRLRSAERQADLIGDLCRVSGSLLEPVGDLGENVGSRVIETRGGTSHRGVSRAGRLIAGRVGEIIARRELNHARVRLEIERCDADSVIRQAQAVRRRRALTTAAPLRVPRALGAFDAGLDRRARRPGNTRVRASLSAYVGRRAMKWDRRRDTMTTASASAAPARASRSTCS